MKRKLILASASLRRQELLRLCNIPFEIKVSNSQEIIDTTLPLGMAIEDVAAQKAKDVFSNNPEALVLGADTIVTVDNEILGKPKDIEDARRMISLLSAKTHKVITGVCFMSKEETRVFHTSTEVTFKEMSTKEIERYVATDEPYDKAGAYALQGQASLYITGIKGDYYTVIGLPVNRVYEYLLELGYYRLMK